VKQTLPGYFFLLGDRKFKFMMKDDHKLYMKKR